MLEQMITYSAEETIQWGREFAKRLKAPVLVLLTGDLGTGKTTLTKGLVSGLGAANEDDVTSPTFTLVHVYGKQAKVYHADLYRIESFHDFETLGLSIGGRALRACHASRGHFGVVGKVSPSVTLAPGAGPA